MLIKCLLGPRTVEFEPHCPYPPAAKYEFKANAKGDSVCEINEEAHVKRLLSITEGYEWYNPKAKKPAALPALTDEQQAALAAAAAETSAANTTAPAAPEDPNLPLAPAT